MQKLVKELRVVIFGASGMVGAAVLDQCLQEPEVLSVLVVGRSPCGRSHAKLREILHADLFDLSPIADALGPLDACFFTLGSSIAGLTEEAYARVNHDLPIAVGKFLLERNPELAFTYVSGVGTDESGLGRTTWARVKGRTENDLLAMPFRAAAMFRLGILVPLRGFPSKTRLYRWFYIPLAPILPLAARLFPGSVSTPRTLGRAMIRAAQGRATQTRLEPGDIATLGA